MIAESDVNNIKCKIDITDKIERVFILIERS